MKNIKPRESNYRFLITNKISKILACIIAIMMCISTLIACTKEPSEKVDETDYDTEDSNTDNTKSETSIPPEIESEKTDSRTEPDTSETTVPQTTASQTEVPQTEAPDSSTSKKEIKETSAPKTTSKSKSTNPPETKAKKTTGKATTDTSETVSVSETTSVETVTDETNKDPIEPTYINGILIVNKTYPLPSWYGSGIDEEARAALRSMFVDAEKDGLDMYFCSGFRSYEMQKKIYNKYLKYTPKEQLDRDTARPGHSEHQTGLAFDIINTDPSFAYTPEGKWLAANCYKYGFIIRYPEGKESITGYVYEPWHVRYLGVEIATSVYNSGLCLEEYLGITSQYQD